MRNAFISSLTALAQRDRNVWLVTGDLGFTVFEHFRDRLPSQFLNAGVAEQNMISTAAGLALSGKRVFVYSIIPFTTLRCLEQIRNDLCQQHLPVCIVGVGAGYGYGHMGSTHHALEDISVMRSLAGMRVVCPCDPLEVTGAVDAIAYAAGPTYLRLGKAGESVLHSKQPNVVLGKALLLRAGTDIAIFATGSVLERALTVADRLSMRGLSAAVHSMHTIKPLDEDAILLAAREMRLLVTLEEHSVIGGLGSAVAETLSLYGTSVRHLLLAVPDAFASATGSQEYHRERAGLTVDQVVKKILLQLPRSRADVTFGVSSGHEDSSVRTLWHG